MSLLLNLMSVLGGGEGFSLNLGDNDFLSTDADGQTVTGSLAILSTGEITWTGDIFGSNENGHTWFAPIGSTDGTGWSVRLSFTSGTNSYSSGAALDTWHLLTTSRTFNFSKATAGGPDSADGIWLLEFSDDGGSTVFDSVSIDDISMFEQAP